MEPECNWKMFVEVKIESQSNSTTHQCHLGLRILAGSTLKIKVNNSRD